MLYESMLRITEINFSLELELEKDNKHTKLNLCQKQTLNPNQNNTKKERTNKGDIYPERSCKNKVNKA